jgi:hypothetical protein
MIDLCQDVSGLLRLIPSSPAIAIAAAPIFPA